MSGFYSNWSFCIIFSCHRPYSQNLSFKDELFYLLHKSTAKRYVMVQGNGPKHNTLLTRDWKQFQNKCFTFCRLISLSQYDSAPKMPWFIISSHTDLKTENLPFTSQSKQQTVATGVRRTPCVQFIDYLFIQNSRLHKTPEDQGNHCSTA